MGEKTERRGEKGGKGRAAEARVRMGVKRSSKVQEARKRWWTSFRLCFFFLIAQVLSCVPSSASFRLMLALPFAHLPRTALSWSRNPGARARGRRYSPFFFFRSILLRHKNAREIDRRKMMRKEKKNTVQLTSCR